MDAQRSCCPKCSKQYCIKTVTPLTGRIPLLLSCKHSVCETCITLSVKLSESLECPVCDQAVELPPKEEMNLILGTKFPVNTYILGQLAIEMSQPKQAEAQEHPYPYINLKELIEKTNKNCFEMDVEFLCETCSKPLCLNCLPTGDKACASHSTISIDEKKLLKVVQEKGDELFCRLTKTAVEIGNRLDKKRSETDFSSNASILTRDIQQHYAKLHAYLQMREKEQLGNMSHTVKSSLELANSAVAKNLIRVKSLLNKLDTATRETREDVNINVQSLMAEMVMITDNTPWYLMELEQPEDQLTVKFNRFAELIDGHINLEGSSTEGGYRLLPSKDVPGDIPPAPLRPVHPPQILVQDVREKDKQRMSQKGSLEQALKAPKVKEPLPKHKHNIDLVPRVSSIKTKSGSISSPNSNESGTQEMVYLDHVVDPDDFYVHLVSSEEELRKMRKSLSSASSFTRPAETQIAIGDLYVGYNRSTKHFERCRIVERKALYGVRYVDSGATDVVAINELRTLPDELKRLPPLALHCKLANVLPISGTWHAETARLMRQIITSKKTVMCVQRTCGHTLECDLTTFVDNLNVAKVLVFHERARFIDPNFKYKRVGMKMGMRTLHPHPKVENGTVQITHVVSPDKFYIRKSDTYIQKLERELQRVYRMTKRHMNQILCPEVGMCVACNTDEYAEEAGGGGWRRGVVKALAGQQRVVLTLPDSGHEITARVSTLRILQQEFYTRPALAVECHLSSISPIDKKWSQASLLSLQRYSGQTLQMYVTDLPDKNRSMGVRLYDVTDGHNIVCINEQLIKDKYAVNIGASSFAMRPFQDMAPAAEHNINLEVPILKKEPKVEETIKNQNVDVMVDREPVKLEVKIQSCQSPSLLYVSLVSQHDIILQLSEELDLFYNDTPPPGKDWKPNEKKLGVFKCHLASIVPAGGDEWPGITCESFKDTVEQYTRHYITKKGNVKDKSMPIELWVHHTTHGGALEPDIREWRLINATLVEQGLAIPVREA